MQEQTEEKVNKKTTKDTAKIFGRVAKISKTEELATMHTYLVTLVFSHNIEPADIANAVKFGLETSFDGVFDSSIVREEPVA